MKGLFVATALLFSVVPVVAATSQADLDVAVKAANAPTLVAILRDETNTYSIRVQAFNALTEKQQGGLWNDPVLTSGAIPEISNRLFFAASNTGQIPLENYPVIIASSLIFIDGTDPYTVGLQGQYLWYRWNLQRHYVKALLKAGKGEEAQSESRRLMGMAPFEAVHLEETVKLISQTIRAANSKLGLNAAIKMQNDYLAAVAKNDLTGIPYVAVPYPAKVPRQNERDDLYNGDYDAVIAWGVNALNDPDRDTSTVISLAAGAWNGKTQLPTGANEYMKTIR